MVVTDVDGTLMDSSHKLPDANLEALRRCAALGVPVVLATGKHRGPWVDALLRAVEDDGITQAASPWTLNAPGVFVQGLLVCGADGVVANRSLLPAAVVDRCRQVADARGWTVLAYADSDTILSNREDSRIERLRALREPTVEVGNASSAAIYKMLFLGEPADEPAVREAVSSFIEGEGEVTVAIPGMVEVLPRGLSKADGVLQALDILGLTPAHALALGDGENDVEMLALVREHGGIAVAVDNARQKLKEVAEVVVSSCDDAGWAEAVNKYALPPAHEGAT